MINQIIDLNYHGMSPGELQEYLEKMYETLPKDRRSKEYKMLRDEYNLIAIIYNKKVNDKIYTIIK